MLLTFGVGGIKIILDFNMEVQMNEYEVRKYQARGSLELVVSLESDRGEALGTLFHYRKSYPNDVYSLYKIVSTKEQV